MKYSQKIALIAQFYIRTVDNWKRCNITRAYHFQQNQERPNNSFLNLDKKK